MNPVIMHADLWGLKPVWVSFSVGLKIYIYFFRCFRCSKYQLKGTIKSKLTHFMQFCSYKLFILAHHCYKKYLLSVPLTWPSSFASLLWWRVHCCVCWAIEMPNKGLIIPFQQPDLMNATCDASNNCRISQWQWEAFYSDMRHCRPYSC